MKLVGTEYVDLVFSEIRNIKMGLSLNIILNNKSMRKSSLGGETETETEEELAPTESCHM